jgi:hypothetical protein
MNKMYMAAPKPDRFRGTLRHYHRAQPIGPPANGKSTRTSATLWLRVAGMVLFIVALIAIISGLFVELSA